MIVTYGDSELKSGIVQIETSSITGSSDPVFGDGGMNLTPVGFELDDIYGAFPASGWVASGDVPEPTSGLLLLLGVAGLALRRKVK